MSQSGRVPASEVLGAREPQVAAVWSQCALCWGQRTIWEPEEARNGEGRVLVAHPCTGCLGLGELMRP